MAEPLACDGNLRDPRVLEHDSRAQGALAEAFGSCHFVLSPARGMHTLTLGAIREFEFCLGEQSCRVSGTRGCAGQGLL